MERDCVRHRKRCLSADKHAKERKKSQMQAVSRGKCGDYCTCSTLK